MKTRSPNLVTARIVERSYRQKMHESTFVPMNAWKTLVDPIGSEQSVHALTVENFIDPDFAISSTAPQSAGLPDLPQF